jgi:predicted negative regulator of RcsB-dependent stress response
MKNKQLIYWILAGIGGYLAYRWWQNSKKTNGNGTTNVTNANGDELEITPDLTNESPDASNDNTDKIVSRTVSPLYS